MRRGLMVISAAGPVVILAIVAGLVAGVRYNERRAVDAALVDFRNQTRADAAEDAMRVEGVLRSVYEGARTIARLPSVRAMDLGSGTFDGDGRATAQEVYNNLASSVALSELYIVPLGMDPDAPESTVGTPREPLTTFDDLITDRNADQPKSESKHEPEAPEIEVFEYRLMARQLAYLQDHFPTEQSVHALEYPVLCGPEVITCDNTRFSPSHPDDKDRSGLVISVPFFGPAGELKGCVSAVILTRAIQDLLPDGDYALGAPGHAYAPIGRGEGVARDHAPDILESRPAGDLLCSFALPLRFADPQSPWVLWRGRADSAFFSRSDVQAARRVAAVSYAGVGGLGIAALSTLLLIVGRLDSVRRQRDALEQQVGERTRELRLLALTDKLTGLPNRALITDRIEQAMARAQREKRARFAVLFLDFDRFKIINDTLGHEAGDQLLLGIAERLRKSLRVSDSASRPGDGHAAARLGGDEFVVLLDGMQQAEDADIVAQRLVGVLAEPHAIAGQQVISTASIGVVRGDLRYQAASDALRDADTAMYEAKAAGKGRYVVFDSAMRERILRRSALDRDLRVAAERGQLVLEYQPIVRLSDGRMKSVEALVRWDHPEFGRIAPSEFIPIAEECGSIRAITDCVVGEACAQSKRWRSELGEDATPRIAVNISRTQLGSVELPEHLLASVRRFGLTPDAIILEVTETAITRDQVAAVGAVKRLKAAGFRLSLDDFGTGYSSLSTLHQFPFDVVKLDRSFIVSTGLGREHAALVHAVVSLAANLGMSVVAEGVETPDQVAALQALDCRYGQGYLFGRAGPPAQIVELARQHRRAA